MEHIDNGLVAMRTIITRIRTIDWVGALTLGDRPLRELIDDIAIIEVIDPTGDTRLVAHGVAGEELLAGPLVEGLFGASDHVHEREVSAESGGVVFHGYVLPIDPDVELPSDDDLDDMGAVARDSRRRSVVAAAPLIAMARVIAWAHRHDSPWQVVTSRLAAEADPDPADADIMQAELDEWLAASCWGFGGQHPGWLVLGPRVVRMWHDVAVASAAGSTDPGVARRAEVVVHLVAHEQCHAISPFPISDIWDAERGDLTQLDWIEEGGAYLLPIWNGHVPRLAEAMGFLSIDEVPRSSWGEPRLDAMRALVALLDLDVDRPQDEHLAFDLLLRPRLTDVPGVLAAALDRRFDLGLDADGLDQLARRVLEIDGDVERVDQLARDIAAPLAAG